MLDLLLVMALGFLGSFGHCVGMCGPLTVAFSLSQKQPSPLTIWQQIYFHSLLNLGRIISYALVGAGIGAVGSLLVAGGQLAGIDSGFRRGLAVFTGILLIWMGLAQIKPQLLPKVPLFHLMLQGEMHRKLHLAMHNLSRQSRWLTPALLGMTWGLIPCGFLYAAQIKAAETGDLGRGSLIMLAFGLGTIPSMLGIGVSTTLVNSNRRSQLFRLGGWVMVLIGGLTLLRNGNTMTDFTGHGAIICLMLALIARPISGFWGEPLRYRRLLGVSAFLLALAHTLHEMQHTFDWKLEAFDFLTPQQKWSFYVGGIALILILPSACTSFDWMMRALGKNWRRIHLLSIPALILCVIHAILRGSHYLGSFELSWSNWASVILLTVITICVLLIRWRCFWALLSLEKFYAPIPKSKTDSQ